MLRSLISAAMMLALPASAAELPSRAQKSEPASEAKACEIKGKHGFLTADGQTCVVVGGYISVHGAFAPH